MVNAVLGLSDQLLTLILGSLIGVLMGVLGALIATREPHNSRQLATFNVSYSVIAALIIVVASFIGGLGLACCIGFIFTVPYENTINAGAAGGSRRFRVRPRLR